MNEFDQETLSSDLQAYVSTLRTEDERQEFAAKVRRKLPEHPTEERLHANAQDILDALENAEDLTIRGVRGVLSEHAFRQHVLPDLVRRGWKELQVPADGPFDYLLEDDSGTVRVQVKMQRSERGRPLMGRGFLPNHYHVVEIQRTRTGMRRSQTAESEEAIEDRSRPYRFGEFDILAVCMERSTGDWASFRYAVAKSLLPKPGGRNDDTDEIETLQPVSMDEADGWTGDFATCVHWMREGSYHAVCSDRYPHLLNRHLLVSVSKAARQLGIRQESLKASLDNHEIFVFSTGNSRYVYLEDVKALNLPSANSSRRTHND